MRCAAFVEIRVKLPPANDIVTWLRKFRRKRVILYDLNDIFALLVAGVLFFNATISEFGDVTKFAQLIASQEI